MTCDQACALAAFLAGCGVGLALGAYLQWCERREVERRAREPVID